MWVLLKVDEQDRVGRVWVVLHVMPTDGIHLCEAGERSTRVGVIALGSNCCDVDTHPTRPTTVASTRSGRLRFRRSESVVSRRSTAPAHR